MTPREFAKYLNRDGHCLHCGTTETLVPQHRSNRGMGGSKKQSPANIIVLCALYNGLIESDAKAAGMALRFGYKLSRYDNPFDKPVYDAVDNTWYFLNDDFTRSELLTRSDLDVT